MYTKKRYLPSFKNEYRLTRWTLLCQKRTNTKPLPRWIMPDTLSSTILRSSQTNAVHGISHHVWNSKIINLISPLSKAHNEYHTFAPCLRRLFKSYLHSTYTPVLLRVQCRKYIDFTPRHSSMLSIRIHCKACYEFLHAGVRLCYFPFIFLDNKDVIFWILCYKDESCCIRRYADYNDAREDCLPKSRITLLRHV